MQSSLYHRGQLGAARRGGSAEKSIHVRPLAHLAAPRLVKQHCCPTETATASQVATSTESCCGGDAVASSQEWTSTVRAGRKRRRLPNVLILHTGGTLGMDPQIVQEPDDAPEVGSLSDNTAGPSEESTGGLRPSTMLANVLNLVPEMQQLSNVSLQVLFNKDSSRVGPDEWIDIAKQLDEHRDAYDGFLVIHGTDTLAYTASALSLMLQGFNKPIIMTGSQLPLAAPRTDARQNLLDSIQCACTTCAPPGVCLTEVAVCFGGRLMRGNRTRKLHSMLYQAFDSPGYPYLAQLGIDVAWNEPALLAPARKYTPRFRFDPNVIRVPVVPGVDPQLAYGDLKGRGVKGVVLEVFGVGNIPDLPEMGWIPWLEGQMSKGLKVLVVSQCAAGPLASDMYAAGSALGALQRQHSNAEVQAVSSALASMSSDPKRSSNSMTPECAVVKLMLALANPDVDINRPLAGEI